MSVSVQYEHLNIILHNPFLSVCISLGVRQCEHTIILLQQCKWSKRKILCSNPALDSTRVDILYPSLLIASRGRVKQMWLPTCGNASSGPALFQLLLQSEYNQTLVSHIPGKHHTNVPSRHLSTVTFIPLRIKAGNSRPQKLPPPPPSTKSWIRIWYCTHHTRTGAGTGNHCFLLCPIVPVPVPAPFPVPCSVSES